MTTTRSGPLSDVRVLDLTQALAGPYCTMLLADLGADVIKIEPPAGDMSRPMGPPPPDREGCDYGGYFASVNRNKRSIVLDIKTDVGREALFKLAKTADAVVENAKTGVMDRMGVGYEVLREHNPKLVYAAIRGFGDPRTGRSPYAEWPCFDVVAQSMGGIVAVTGPVGTPGSKVGVGVGDIYPGTLAALGVVSAIHAARRDGVGQFIDVAMYDAILALCETMVYTYARGGIVREPAGNGTSVLCPFDIFPTSDGAVAIASPGENHWGILCNAMGHPGLVNDDRCRTNVRRVANSTFVRGVISEWTKSHETHEVVAALGGKVPVGPVNSVKDIFEDPHPKARNMLVEVEQPGNNPPLVIAGSPIKMTATPPGIYARPPLLGEHTAEVLAEVGITTDSKE